MKKSPLLLLSLTALLASCSGIRFGYVEEQHSAGLADGRTMSQQTYAESKIYFAGDSINESNEYVANITFTAKKSNFDMATEDIAAILSCDVDNIFDKVADASLTGTTEDVGLFIGTSSTLRDGYLTLAFSAAIKDLKIEACPYYYIDTSWNKEEFVVDDNVAVAVNNSGYIKLSSLKDEETGEIKSTPCRYHLANDTREIKIKVGQKRAYIRKIVLYY